MNTRTRSLAAALVAASAASTLVGLGVGSASAAGPAGELIGGRGRIKVVVDNSATTTQMSCKLQIGGYTPFSSPLSVGPHSTRSLVKSGVSAGNHLTQILCKKFGTNVTVLQKSRVLTVAQPNPGTDSIDLMFANMGSSSMVSDKTLLP
ncbi:hypothetical protein HUN08_00950 [Gordonia sp. X0973]|uniref:hypothetical protein n=1 Tax=Gordonia sp. X0973 TaxID=2742602 RepID=UPI000F53FB9C|nr:hypothetical protein [Gordonia sp. X0973]QKT05916.1 hypothetical protein HUN08_00950 [Gordonia sp. X0973]